jgi:hypothetical protein
MLTSWFNLLQQAAQFNLCPGLTVAVRAPFWTSASRSAEDALEAPTAERELQSPRLQERERT